MKKIIFALFFMLFGTVLCAQAQDYNTGIGVRGGTFNGLTIKHFLTESTAVEGVLTTRWDGWMISGTWEKHQEAFEVPKLKWFYGVGGQIGFWNDNASWGDPNHGNYSVIGVHGALGLEYTFEEIPFSVGADWKPMLNLSGYSGFWGDNVGVTIRYNF